MIFQIPRARASAFVAMKASLTMIISCFLLSDSNRLNVLLMFIMAVMGVLNSIAVIMSEKICSELPAMYIPIALIGSCFAGAIATSHAFLSFRESVSACVGGLRAGVLEFFDLDTVVRGV